MSNESSSGEVRPRLVTPPAVEAAPPSTAESRPRTRRFAAGSMHGDLDKDAGEPGGWRAAVRIGWRLLRRPLAFIARGFGALFGRRHPRALDAPSDGVPIERMPEAATRSDRW